MISEVRDAVGALEAAVGGLSPERLDGRDAARLLKVLAKGERLCAAGKARVVRRVDETGVWRDSGQPSAAAFLAATTGTTLGQAIGTLATAERLEELPATAEAFMAGQLSETQAREISAAASVDPTAEPDLLRAAEVDTVKGLKSRCARVKAAAIDDAERERRIHKTRYFRHWSDADGAFRAECKLTAAAGATVLAALRPETERIFHAARTNGDREAHEAYAADALVAVADRAAHGDTATPSKHAVFHLHADVAAMRRGHTERGDTVVIDGVGPVSVHAAREVLPDAFLTLVLEDGVDVLNVTHIGRHRSAEIETALRAMYHGECGVAGCHHTRGLEHHHVVDYATTGHTRLAELVPLCPRMHHLVTHRGWTLHHRPDGQWDITPPDPPAHGERAPP